MKETQETWVRPLGQEDPLEYEMATHSSNLAWKIPWTEEPGGPRDPKELDTTLLSLSLPFSVELVLQKKVYILTFRDP